MDRAWIQSVAGADLNTTTCSSFPAAGSSQAPIAAAAGVLSPANAEDRYTLAVPSGGQLLWTTLNGEGPFLGDYDLYVKRGSPPSRTDFDCSSEQQGQFEACGVPNFSAGTWHFLVDRSSGTGLYQMTTTTYLGNTTGGSECVPNAQTLCLRNRRFRVTVDFRQRGALSKPATAVPFTDSSGLFWFFSQDNSEMLVKVLDACVEPFNRYWVFFAATTNVEFEVVVEDTLRGAVRRYPNPQGMTALPIQDTQAFATCP
ncbi:MAG: PPC domain-containing protein [Acidobacteriota bacterium]